MFKIEVDVSGTTHGHYFMNKHKDDFLQFVPKYFTRIYGEDITSDNISVYKIDEENLDLLEGKLAQHNANSLDSDSETGKLKICRCDKPIFNVGDKVPLDQYNNMRAMRDEKFKDAVDKVKLKTKVPTSKLEDIGNGEEEVVTIKASDDLANDAISEELELVGTALAQWPYDSKGKFLGNK